ncbi:hypothetical protein BDAP_000444 [Binucleata daphniae]
MHEIQINAIDTDSCTNTFIASCQDNLLRIYSMDDTVNPLQTLQGHYSPIISCVYLNQNKYIASFSLDGTLLIYELENEKYSIKVKIKNDKKNGVAMCATKKLNKIYVAFCDGSVVLYDFKNEMDVKSLEEACKQKINEQIENLKVVNFDYDTKEIVKMENEIIAMSCNNKIVVVCDENGYWDGKYNKKEGIRDVSVRSTNNFDINCYCYITENEIVVNDQQIPVNGARSVKWCENGLSFVVGMENGSVKGYSVNSDGKFVEVDMEKIQ